MNKFLKSGLYLSSALVAVAAVAPAMAQEEAGGLQDIVVTAQKREQNLQDVPIAVTALTGDALTANRVTSFVNLGALAPGLTVRSAPGASQTPIFIIRGVFSSGNTPGMDKQVSTYLDGVYMGSPRGSIFDLPNVERIEVLRGPQGTLFGRNATAGAIAISTVDPKGEAHMKASASVSNYDGRRYELSAHTPQLGPLSAYFNFTHEKYRGSVHNGRIETFDRSTYALQPAGIVKSSEWLGGKDSDSVFAAVKFESGGFKAVYKYDRNDTVATPSASALAGYNWSLTGQAALYNDVLNGIYRDAEAAGMPIVTDGKRPDEVWNSYSTPIEQANYGHNLTINYQVSDQVSIKNVAAYRASRVASTTGLGGVNALPITARASSYLTSETLADYPVMARPAVRAIVDATFPQGSLLCSLCVGTATRAKQWSNELQINYDSDFLTLTVGGLYYRAKDWTNEHGLQGSTSFAALEIGEDGLPALPFFPGITYNDAKSLAAYAQSEFHLTPQLDLVLGGRFTHDNKLNELSSLTAAATGPGACPVIPPSPSGIETSAYRLTCYETNGLATLSNRYKDDNFNYLIGLNYTLDDGTLLYAKWSTAFVSGGTMGPIAYKPEKSKSAEVGVKTDLFNRRLRVNLAAYWAQYDNYQVPLGVGALQGVDFLDAAVPDARVRNALTNVVLSQGRVGVKGVELEVTAAPTDGVVLGGSLSYTDAKAKTIDDQRLFAWQGFPTINGSYDAYSASDYHLQARPKWTGNVFAQYTSRPIWGDATFTARIQGNYQSRVLLAAYDRIDEVDPNYVKDIPGYWLINGRVALQNLPIGDFKGTLALWGQNLTDNKSASIAANVLGVPTLTFIEPRRYGLDFTVEF